MLKTPRTAADREARRTVAVERVAGGWTQKAVAEFLGVHPVTVNKWVRAHRDDPDAGLAAKPRPGRAPYLTEAQGKKVLGWLADKPTDHGFPTDLWTARRVADLIRRKFKVAYHPGYLRAWMVKRGYSPQKPAKVAREQDPAELARWLADGWSGLRKKNGGDAPHVVLIDETGLFLNPLVRRTWAPVGRTPVYRGPARHREKVSVIGALAVSPRAKRVSFYFATEPNGYFGPEKVVGFLRHLRGNVAVVWDGGGNHKGPAIRALPARHRRLRLVGLPAYSPDLNPVEAVWSWLKYGQLCNFVPTDTQALTAKIGERLVALQSDPRLVRQLWKASGLPFPEAPAPTQRE